MVEFQNKGGLGNPYHDDTDGMKFTSKEGGGSVQPKISSSNFLDLLKKNSDKKNADIDALFGYSTKPEIITEMQPEQQQSKLFESAHVELNQNAESLSSSEVNTMLQGFEDVFDLDKMSGLSDDEIKQIIQAQVDLSKMNSEDPAIKYSKMQFIGLWSNTVTPLDYEEKKSKIQAKLDYFKNVYQGPNPEQKIEKLNNFVQAGEEYLAAKQEFENKYKAKQDLVNQFTKPDFAYSKYAKDNAVWAKSKSESESIFAAVSDPYIEGLKETNPDVCEAVENYTGSYSSINEPLRHIKYYGEPYKYKEFKNAVNNMTKAIDGSSYNFNCWVQRGTTKITDIAAGINIEDYISESSVKDLIGKVYKDQGFCSCGAAKATGFTHKPIIINTYCPAGTKMLYMANYSLYSGENEIILQRGYSYRITNAYYGYDADGDKKLFLDVEVILGSDKDKYTDKELDGVKEDYFANK